LQTREPAFTEDEARHMQLLTVESDGDIESTVVARNGEEQFGIVSLYVHLKAPPEDDFKAEITYREDDGRTTTEGVF
jgi:hypothetical protein